MGNSQSTNSTVAPVEQVIRPQEPSTSVQFAPSLLTQLTSSSSEPTSSSSNHHDPVILSRLQAEVQKLRSEEAQILSSISSALEKENLDRSTGKDGEAKSLNSVVLSRDLEVVREKVERMMGKRAGALGQKGESSEVEEGRRGLVQCYLNNPTQPLDCYKQVDSFKNIVGKLEKEFVASLS